MAQSEMLTHDGYPAVKLENGSHMTEYSITVTDPRLNNGRPTNIPSLWERKIVDQDTAVNKAIQSKKEYKSFDTIKDAVSDSERKSNAGGANAPKEYNRGGTVRNLLATGGMMQEGGTTDPVSGNDVPIGSLKEEVRDDVPAQLSPGEFVFPADVTRYIGLDKLMQIREAAKEGLKEMESKGQMGNAEEVEGDAVDEDKFSTNIDEIIANLDGGDDSEPKKFAEGGSVNTSDYSAAPIKGFKMVQYEDVETKTVKYIPFVNGKALLPIPKGYVEKKAAAPVAPVAPVVPVEDQAALARAGGGGGGGGRGGKSETDGDGGSVSGEPNDAGIEGFGDIQGGTNPNIARAAGFAAGLINPVVGLLVGAAGAYVTKENNKKMAAANAQAIDASALAAAGFDARDIKFAQEAAAKATLEGKSAKDIALAAANAASVNPSKSIGGEYGPRTSLDALVGITNGFNTANKDVMAMPQELADKVEPRTWNDVVKAIQEGLTPEQAVQRVAETTFAGTVGSYFTGTMSEKEAAARLDGAGLDGRVPAGEFDNVVNDMKDGYSPEQAVQRAEERAAGPTDSQLAEKDATMRQEAKDNADKAQAERNAEVTKQEADRTAQQAASERAAQQASERAAQQAAQDASERAAQQAAQAEADRVPVRESSSGGRGGNEAPGTGSYGDARSDLRGGGFND
jgi:hypothetical protein